jgi:hypothetical protein
MNDARSHALIAEVEQDLERAADDLACALSDLFPERFIELFEDEEDDDEVDASGRRLIKGAIDERPDREIDEALETFNRAVRRIMKQMREAAQ